MLSIGFSRAEVQVMLRVCPSPELLLYVAICRRIKANEEFRQFSPGGFAASPCFSRLLNNVLDPSQLMRYPTPACVALNAEFQKQTYQTYWKYITIVQVLVVHRSTYGGVMNMQQLGTGGVHLSRPGRD